MYDYDDDMMMEFSMKVNSQHRESEHDFDT